MAYNEPLFLPIWLRHYTAQVGGANCIVIDHGSDDGSTDALGKASVIRLPRSPHDDERRARFVGKTVAGLLEYYDWVIYSDVDELLVADPARFADIPAFCAHAAGAVVTAIGLDVQHVPGLEPAFDPARPVGAQRGWVRFTSAMCKPALTRRPLTWSPGFHSADAALRFSHLYLFHLRWFDRAAGLARLAKTRSMAWEADGSGVHQRLDDPAWTTMFDKMAGFPRVEGVSFEQGVAPMRRWLDMTVASAAGRECERYPLDLQVNAGELWAIPPQFRAIL
jgi:hypothetical protein